jgi:hypothetical protein
MREIGDQVSGRGGNGDGSVEPTSFAPMHHWLYPMLAGGPGHFEGSDRRYRADFEVYRRAAMAGRIVRGEGPLAAGFRSIREHDVLWLFAGGEAGVVGRATVREVFGRPEPRVRFTLDRATSRVLAQDPLPGALVRRSLPRAHHGPVSLAEHAGLTEGLEWWVDQLDDRDHRRLDPVGVPTLRRVIARRPTLLNDPSLAGLVRTLRAFDCAVGVQSEGNASYLVGLGERRLVVGCLVRGGQVAQPTPAVLRTIAAVGWRAWSLKEQLGAATLEPNEWFAFSRAPHPHLVRFLEDGDRSVSWFQGGQMELGPRTRLRWLAPTPRATAATKPPSPMVVKFDTTVIEETPAVPENVSFRRRLTD